MRFERESSLPRGLILVTLTSLGAPLQAADDPEELSRFLSAFENLPPSVYRPDLARAELGEALTAGHPGLRRFLAGLSGRFRVEWNEATGTPHRIFGHAIPLRLPDGSAPVSGEEMEQAVRLLVSRHGDLFGVRPEGLLLETEKDLSTFRLLRFRQVHGGIPVLGTRFEAWVAPGGRAVLLGSDVVPERLLAGCASLPHLDGVSAQACARAHAAGAGISFHPARAALRVVPIYHKRRIIPRLVWEVPQVSAGMDEKWVYLVAAADDPQGFRSGGGWGGVRAGQVIGRWDQAARGSVSGTVRGKASPGLFPDTSWNPPQFDPLLNLEVNAGPRRAITGPDGAFSISYPGDGAVTVTASLKGPYCTVINQAGTDLTLSQSAPSGSQIAIDLNSFPTEFATAQVNAFREVNRAHDFAKALDPTFTAIDRPIRTEVNLPDSCNAYFIPEGEGLLAFVRSKPCANSAYSTVILHEYAHFVVWKAFGSVNPMPAYNEGVADTYAAFITDQPVIGHAFGGVEGGGPIRNLERSPPLRYPWDLLQEFHIAGGIVGGAFWDLRRELGASLGPQGLDLARRLYFRSLFLAPAMISPDLTLDLLELDDDDGVLSNGTPHFREIAAAFSRHGLEPPGQLFITHSRLRDSASPGPFLVRSEVRSDFDFVTPSAVRLYHSVDGGFHYTAQAMLPAGGSFQAEIPAQPFGTTVLYYLEAEGTGGARAVFPAGTTAEETVAFAVGEVAAVFSDDFDGPETGWSHGLVPSANPENRDDWQRGAPRPGVPDPENYLDGTLLDPEAAFSGPHCWGNDLALDGRTDKNYPENSRNFLQSPPIDCSGRFGVHLRFRRWLTIERFDRARILVNGVPIYQSPSDRDTLDIAWRAMDYNISGLADGRLEVRVRFELSSNLEGNAGGWNIDDFAVVSTGVPPLPRPSLTGIEPAFDFKAGGARFTLRGSGFTTAADTRLSFGQSQAEGFTVDDGGTIAGTVPSSTTPGPVTISIQNGRGAAALPGAFTYFDLPTLEAVIPPQGRLAGGTPVSVHGDYYTPGSGVLIGGRPLLVTAQVGNQAILGALPQGGDIGPVDVVIRGAYGESRFPAAFTYAERPTLTGVEPEVGPLEGGIEFTLRGTFFPDQGEVVIDFGARRVASFEVLSRTAIRGLVPAGEEPGTVDLKITTPGGSAELPRAFHYLDPSRPPVFIRSDSNLDRSLEITDPILVLSHLFLAEGQLLCRDAADVNDDGKLDISDPVAALSFLFTGGPAPPPPHPAPGPDPTEDALGCLGGL